MNITNEDLEKSVGGVFSRFGIDKDKARRARKALNEVIAEHEMEEASQEEADERYYAYFMDNFGMVDLSVEDILIPTLTTAEQSVYRRFYRLSFCCGRTWCQVSHSELREACNISSEMTVRKAIRGLRDAHCVRVIAPSIQRKPPVYRVYLPCEMPQFADMDFQTSIVFTKEETDATELRTIYNSEINSSMLENNIIKISRLEELKKE